MRAKNVWWMFFVLKGRDCFSELYSTQPRNVSLREFHLGRRQNVESLRDLWHVQTQCLLNFPTWWTEKQSWLNLCYSQKALLFHQLFQYLETQFIFIQSVILLCTLGWKTTKAKYEGSKIAILFYAFGPSLHWFYAVVWYVTETVTHTYTWFTRRHFVNVFRTDVNFLRSRFRASPLARNSHLCFLPWKQQIKSKLFYTRQVHAFDIEIFCTEA